MRRNRNQYHFFTDERTQWRISLFSMTLGILLGLSLLLLRSFDANQESKSGVFAIMVLMVMSFCLSPGNPFYQQIREAQNEGYRALDILSLQS